MKATLVFILLAACLVSANVEAKIRCTVNGSVTDTTKVYGLRINRSGQDPKDSPYNPVIRDRRFSCTVEADEIEKYSIVDLGEVLKKGHTSRVADFLVEDDAVIDITIDGDNISVTSTGKESKAWEKGESAIGFMLDLNDRMKLFNLADKSLKRMLDTYHSNGYDKAYPGHSVHKKIADGENYGYQMIGGKYNDYKALTLTGDTARASDHIQAGRLTLVICWATWCAPCRKEALSIVPLYERYHDKGLDAFGLAREFQTLDDVNIAVKQDKYPWPTIVDRDDEFQLFNKHGVTSSGFYLIDGDGTIITASYSIDDIRKEIEKRLDGC